MAAARVRSEPSKDKVLTTAPPPWHTVVLVVGLCIFFVHHLPSLESLDETATLATIQNVVFPDTFSVTQVAYFRLVAGSIMLLDALYVFLYGSWTQDTIYFRPASKLKTVQAIPFRGLLRTSPVSIKSAFMTWSSFTVWCWILEGSTFCLLGSLALLPADSSRLVQSPWAFRAAIVGWEISAPNSLLVSAIVKYVLWPLTLGHVSKTGGNRNHVLKQFGPLMKHNWNVIAALIDLGIAGGLPVRYQDFALAPLFGMVYIVFAWSMMHSWCDAAHGPQFMYSFFDTTLGWKTSACLLALLLVLLLSFGIFALADHVLAEYLGGGLGTHCLAVVFLAACVCRVRD